jgi:hypothetical protein
MDVLASEGQDLLYSYPNMKAYNSIVHLFCLTCASLICTGCASNSSGPATTTASAAASSPNTAHVLVYRVANFGTDLSVIVSVDGKDVAALDEGRRYDGYVAAGQHVLAARVDPNRSGTPVWRKKVTLQAGQTYVYTAAWSGENLVLAKGQ